MSRKDVTRLFDRMSPDNQQIQRMLENVLMAAEENGVSDENESTVKVINYSRRKSLRRAVMPGAAAAAAAVVCLAGYNLMKNTVVPVSPDAGLQGDSMSEFSTNEEEQLFLEGSAHYSFVKNEYSGNEDKTEMDYCIGYGTGHMVFEAVTTVYEAKAYSLEDMSQEIYFTDSEGRRITILWDIVCSDDYICTYGCVESLRSIYVYDRNFELAAEIPDDSVMRMDICGDSIFCITADGYLRRYDFKTSEKSEICFDDLSYTDIPSDIYVSDSGEIALLLEERGEVVCTQVDLFSTQLEYNGKIVFTADDDVPVCGEHIVAEYDDGYIITDLNSELYIADRNRGIISSAGKLTSTLKPFERLLRGFGEYMFAVISDNCLYGIRKDDGSAEQLNSVPLQPADEILFAFDYQGQNYAAVQLTESSRRYKITDEDLNITDIIDTETENCRNVSAVNGHIFEESYDNDEAERVITVSDTDISTGEKREVQFLSGEGVPEIEYTENYIIAHGMEWNPDAEGYMSMTYIYNRNGERINAVQDMWVQFTDFENDIIYGSLYGISDYRDIVMNISTGEIKNIQTEYPWEDCIMSAGNFGYKSFACTDRGIYGIYLSGDTLKTRMLVDFDNVNFKNDLTREQMVRLYCPAPDRAYADYKMYISSVKKEKH